ncbi:MAG TPA: acyl carrier protein [Bacteroidota bacterium]|nr:acyl carrier protein [Bacteroidota bacterium]
MTLLELVNTIRSKRGLVHLNALTDEMKLRGDIGFDSLDLAEFVVKVERQYGVDVFALGVLETIGEVRQHLGI